MYACKLVVRRKPKKHKGNSASDNQQNSETGGKDGVKWEEQMHVHGRVTEKKKLIVF